MRNFFRMPTNIFPPEDVLWYSFLVEHFLRVARVFVFFTGRKWNRRFDRTCFYSLFRAILYTVATNFLCIYSFLSCICYTRTQHFTFRAQNATLAAPYIHLHGRQNTRQRKLRQVQQTQPVSWELALRWFFAARWNYHQFVASPLICTNRTLQPRTLESYLIQQWSTDPLANFSDNADLPSNTTHVTHHSTDPPHHVTGVTHRSTVHVAGKKITHPLSDLDPTTDQAQDTEQHLFANTFQHFTATTTTTTMTTSTTTITTTASQAPRSAVVHPLNTSKTSPAFGFREPDPNFHHTNTAPTWTWAWMTLSYRHCRWMCKQEAAEWTVSPSDHTTLQVYHSIIYYYVIYRSCAFTTLMASSMCLISDSYRRFDFELEKTLVVSLNPVYRQQPCHYTIWFPVDFYFHCWLILCLILHWFDHKQFHSLMFRLIGSQNNFSAHQWRP